MQAGGKGFGRAWGQRWLSICRDNCQGDAYRGLSAPMLKGAEGTTSTSSCKRHIFTSEGIVAGEGVCGD